jgi:DNA-binding transcriptional LysR family regulator
LAGLEAFVGQPLLQKQGRGLLPTRAGREYWQKITGSLRTIETATFELRSGGAGSGMLTLASVPTFLTKWLVPRLMSFRRQHPHITLSFREHLGPYDSIAPGVDAAVRYGEGNWPGMVSEYIAGHEFVLVAAPGLLEATPLQWPAQLVKHTLLHHEEAVQAWRLWAAQHGAGELPLLSGPRFAQYSSLIQAACSGLGVGLVPRLLVEDELASDTLRIPCGETIKIDQGHYLCYREERLEQPAFMAFRSWILSAERSIPGS